MLDKLVRSLDNVSLTINMYRNASVIQSKAYSKFLKELANAIDNDGVMISDPWFKTECGVIYITINDVISGHLVFSNKGQDVLYLINLSVDSKYAHLNFYKELLAEFENIAKENHYLSISATISIDNTDALEAAHDMGLIVLYKQLFKRIE